MAFCRYCGRKLNDGEICNCRSGGAPGSMEPQGTSGNQRRSKADVSSGENAYEAFGVDREKVDRAKERLHRAGNAAANFAGEAAGRAGQAAAAGGAAAAAHMRSGGAYERKMQIVNQCIVAMEDEIPVRQYDIAVLRTIFPYKRAEGRLQVTNKRVVFRATGKSMLGSHFYENEFLLSEIAGVELKKDRLISGWHILASLFLTLVSVVISTMLFSKLISNDSSILFFLLMLLIGGGGAALAFFVKKLNWLKMVLFEIPAIACLMYHLTLSFGFYRNTISLWIIPAILFGIAAVVFFLLYAITEDLIIAIKVNNAGNVVEIRRKLGRKREYTGYSEVLPGKDTETAARELGALINDVKMYGDAGIAKWR